MIGRAKKNVQARTRLISRRPLLTAKRVFNVGHQRATLIVAQVH